MPLQKCDQPCTSSCLLDERGGMTEGSTGLAVSALSKVSTATGVELTASCSSCKTAMSREAGSNSRRPCVPKWGQLASGHVCTPVATCRRVQCLFRAAAEAAGGACEQRRRSSRVFFHMEWVRCRNQARVLHSSNAS